MKTIQKLTLAVVAVAAMTACTQNDKPKFDAKEYAERKTERLDKIVDLSDAQEKEVYALYLAQGKEIKENIKTLKKECGEMKKPDCEKAECDKPCAKKAECTKACDKAKCEKPCAKKAECKKECTKPCDKKAECTKACDKAKCEKPCAKKAECTKACDKAKCEKPCAKKAECKKACDKAKCEKPCAKKAECTKACDKAKCEKPCAKKAECAKACDKAKCDKPCDKKAECKQGHKHHKKHFRHHSLVSPERKKATFEQLGTILTPEQSAKLREHHARRHMCNQNKQCVPCNAQGK